MMRSRGEEMEDERKRLSSLYASMSDEELEELAKDAKSLNEEGKQALRAELTTRELTFEGEISPERSDAIDNKLELVTVGEYRDLPQAVVAKGLLDSAGIPCYLADENIIRMDWMWSNLMGGAKLRVRKEDAEVATELLKQDLSEEPDPEAGQEPR